jgi:hypothetical protein
MSIIQSSFVHCTFPCETEPLSAHSHIRNINRQLWTSYTSKLSVQNSHRTTSCTANPQQIHNFSTNPQHLDMSRCCGLVVDSTANRNSGVWLSTCPQQIEKLYNKSTANLQLYDKSYSLLYNKPTANPQQIEQEKFELIGTPAKRETGGVIIG